MALDQVLDVSASGAQGPALMGFGVFMASEHQLSADKAAFQNAV